MTVQLNIFLEFAKRPANLPIPLPADSGSRLKWDPSFLSKVPDESTDEGGPLAPEQPKEFVLGEMAPCDTQAVRETLPMLEKVKARAVQRVRAFLISK